MFIFDEANSIYIQFTQITLNKKNMFVQSVISDELLSQTSGICTFCYAPDFHRQILEMSDMPGAPFVPQQTIHQTYDAFNVVAVNCDVTFAASFHAELIENENGN